MVPDSRIKILALMVLVSVTAISLSPVYAHTLVYTLQNGTPVFQMTVPDGWRLDLDYDTPLDAEDDPPRVVEAIPKDGAKLWLGMWVLREIEDISEAREFFDSLEQYILSDVVVNTESDENLNGMPAHSLRGTAKKETEAVDWAIVMFQVKPETVAAILYIGVPEAWKQRKTELTGMIESVESVSN